MELFNKKSTKEKRNNLKKNLTLEEKLLWEKIRKDQLGVRFRRQYGIGEYIVDFYAPKLRLVIEIDGEQHHTKEGMEYDILRENYMKELGIITLRFSNKEVNHNIEDVIMKIISTIKLNFGFVYEEKP